MDILVRLKKFFSNLLKKEKVKLPESNYEDELFNKYGKCETRESFGIKILFIADTHDCLSCDKETLDFIKNTKDYDCCILLGDHSANDLRKIINIIPKEKLYGVLGNHDSWDKLDEYNITNISGKVIQINGIKIAGLSGSFKYKDSSEYALYTHEESIDIANNMPQADILISHDKPFTKPEFGQAHDGIKGITEYMYKNHVSLNIHGHLHENSEQILKNGAKSICLYKAKLLNL